MKTRVSKTYVTAAIAILTAWGAWLCGESTVMGAVQASFTALMACFVRAAVVRNGLGDNIPAVMVAMGVLAGSLLMTSCAGSGPVSVGYGLPHDGGRIDVTLFPDKLFGHSGKGVAPLAGK